MIRFFWRVLTAVLCFAALALILIVTPLGLKLAAPIVNRTVDDIHIQTKGVSGTLLGPIKAKNIIINQGNNQYQVTELNLKWQVLRLFLGQIRVHKITANRVHILLGKSGPSSSSNKMDIPHLTVQSLFIKHITLVSSMRDQAITLQNIHGSALTRPDTMAINLMTKINLPGITHANIHLNGTNQDYTFSAGLLGPNTNARIMGSGTQQSLNAVIPKSALLHGAISGSLNLTWLPRWQWYSQITMSGVRFNEWEKRLPAISTAELSSHGYLTEDGTPHFYYKANVNSQELTLKSNGHISHDNKQISWKLKGKDFNLFFPRLPSGTIETSGTWHNGKTQGSLKANSIVWEKYALGEINTTWDAVMSPFTINHLNLDAKQLKRSTLTFNDIKASIDGNKDNATLTGHITTSFPKWKLSKADFKLLAKRNSGNRWEGRWEHFDMTGPHGSWTLGAHPQVSISPEGIKQPSMCWAHKHRALCTHWSFLGDRWAVHIKGQNLPLDTWLPLRIPRTTEQGGNHVSLDVSQTLEKPVNLKGHIELTNGHIDPPYPYEPIHINHATLDSTLDNSNWVVHSAIDFEHNGKLRFDGTVKRTPDKTWWTRDLKASLDLHSDNFTPLEHLIPNLNVKNASISTKAICVGSFSHPIFSGTLSAKHADATISPIGTTIRSISVENTWNKNTYHYHVTNQNKTSPLVLDADGDLDSEAWHITTHSQLTGHNLLIFNQPDYTVYADPTLSASFVDHNLIVNGKVNVFNTDIKPTSLTEAHSIPSDVSVLENGKPKRKEHDHLGLNVALTVGKNVKIDTHIFKADLGGKIQLSKKPGAHPYLGNGKLVVTNGKMSLLRNNYFVNNATLSYKDSPITEPTMNIKIFRLIKRSRLSRKHGPRTVGLHITGAFRYPVILPFSSDPSLSNNDIVSYFAFNRPSSAGQPFHAAALLNALAELPNNGGNLDPKTRSALIKQAIGFNEMGVQSGVSLASIGAPISGYDDAFVVGRYLSSNIYIRYTRGISSAYSIYQVRYNFTPSISIQTESGSLGSGGDLLYSFTSLLHPKTSALKK